jgi:hypothetical protein
MKLRIGKKQTQETRPCTHQSIGNPEEEGLLLCGNIYEKEMSQIGQRAGRKIDSG